MFRLCHCAHSTSSSAAAISLRDRSGAQRTRRLVDSRLTNSRLTRDISSAGELTSNRIKQWSDLLSTETYPERWCASPYITHFCVLCPWKHSIEGINLLCSVAHHGIMPFSRHMQITAAAFAMLLPAISRITRVEMLQPRRHCRTCPVSEE